jgi:serine protease Do
MRKLQASMLPWAVLLFVGVAAAQEEPTSQPTGLQFAASIERSLEAAIAKAEKSVVAIAGVKRNDSRDTGFGDTRLPLFDGLQRESSDAQPTDPDFVPSAYGTGVVIDRNGWILTNLHVLTDPKESDFYVTTTDRKVYAAKIEAADPRSDLAVLKIDASDLVPISFGDGAALKKGQIVIALGNPYAIARDGQASASWGIVSNIQRKAGRTPDASNPKGKSTLHQLGTLIQTDAKLNLGTSGGALLNLQGEMVGLTTSLSAAVGYEQAAGYAIPVDETFRRVVERLKKGELPEYGFLGVAPENLPASERVLGKHGALVNKVVWGTPAQRMGLQQGDLITHVNEQPIYDADGLVLRVGSQPADAEVTLAVERAGSSRPVKLTLAKYRITGTPIFTQPLPTWRGLRVDHWTAVIDVNLGQTETIDPNGCLMVASVEADSPAAKQGLKPQMIVTHVDGVSVACPKDFSAAVAGKHGPVKLRIAELTDAVRTRNSADGDLLERTIEAE